MIYDLPKRHSESTHLTNQLPEPSLSDSSFSCNCNLRGTLMAAVFRQKHIAHFMRPRSADAAGRIGLRRIWLEAKQAVCLPDGNDQGRGHPAAGNTQVLGQTRISGYAGCLPDIPAQRVSLVAHHDATLPNEPSSKKPSHLGLKWFHAKQPTRASPKVSRQLTPGNVSGSIPSKYNGTDGDDTSAPSPILIAALRWRSP